MGNNNSTSASNNAYAPCIGIVCRDRETGFWPSVAAITMFFFYLLKLYSNSTALDNLSILAYVLLTVGTLFTCLRLNLVTATSWLVILICYEPATRTVMPEIGRAYTLYTIMLCSLILFIRRREFSWPALLFFCVAVSFYLHVLVDFILVKGLSFDILYIPIYRTGMNQGTMYLGAALMTFFVKGWRPQREDFLTVVRVGIVAIIGLIILSIIQCSYMTLLSRYESFVMGIRLYSVGNFGANSFAAICSLAILSLLVIRLNKGWHWVLKIGMMICLGALLFSKSRAQIFGIFLLLPVVAFFVVKNWGIALYWFAYSYLIIGTYIFYDAQFFDKFFEFFEFKTRNIYTLTGRVEIWTYCLELIKKNMLWGVNSVEYITFFSEKAQLKPTHNPFLSVTVYNGIFVGLAFLFAHINLVKSALARWKQADHGHKMILFTSIACILLHQSFDLWYYIYFWFLSWAIIDFRDQHESSHTQIYGER